MPKKTKTPEELDREIAEVLAKRAPNPIKLAPKKYRKPWRAPFTSYPHVEETEFSDGRRPPPPSWAQKPVEVKHVEPEDPPEYRKYDSDVIYQLATRTILDADARGPSNITIAEREAAAEASHDEGYARWTKDPRYRDLSPQQWAREWARAHRTYLDNRERDYYRHTPFAWAKKGRRPR